MAELQIALMITDYENRIVLGLFMKPLLVKMSVSGKICYNDRLHEKGQYPEEWNLTS